MSSTYLQTAYKDRERVKGLGARWDPQRKQWFVPAGRDLTPFAAWLPADSAAAADASTSVVVARESSNAVVVPTQGIGLADLLNGLAQVVAQAYRQAQWVRLEVARADARGGHVYLEVAERSAQGDLLAQARAVIWADTARLIVPAFEQATGVVLGAGIKLLVRARPSLHPQYGLSLHVDALDPEYTLGDLEAKKREIRERLQREGLFDRNRRLPAAWDYRAVLVVAPPGAAGLGDFLAEAQRLQRWGLCRFRIVHSRFQGEGAASEIRAALLQALAQWATDEDAGPDAVALIRGGGAVNDLAWLNDYDLACCLCELPVPVLTGIGHERDSTVLDEVAHTRYDTPSKVIAGIEQRIVSRAREVGAAHQEILQAAAALTLRQRQAVEQQHQAIRSGARLALSEARRRADQQFQAVRQGSLLRLQQARWALPATLADLSTHARQHLRSARERSHGTLQQVADAARAQVHSARSRAEALMREVAGQGPARTLARGFALVRAADGAAVSSAQAARAAGTVQLEFRDGSLPARVAPAAPRRPRVKRSETP